MALLERDELSVNELQQISRLGQSRISTHLRQLQEADLLQSRREGKRTFYRLRQAPDALAQDFIQLAVRGAREMHEYAADQLNLKRILARRSEQAQVYFNQIAGRFDRSYGPGRSWQAFGQMLLRVIPSLVVADLGAGEGLLSELLARRANFTGIAGWVSPKAICTAGWRRPASGNSKSASSPAKSNPPISRPSSRLGRSSSPASCRRCQWCRLGLPTGHA